jgi:plasmid stabilization system protein ParE
VNIRLLLPADEEFAEAVLWYYNESPSTARRFKNVIEESIRAVAANPTRYRKYSRNIRVKVVRGFPYSIFFSIDPTEIVVTAIAHDAREPGYWQHRV